MSMRVQRLLREGLELQARLRLPVRIGIGRAAGSKALALEVVEAWSVRPVCSEDELDTLGALRGGELSLPAELRSLYSQVGDGFRYAFQEVPSTELLLRAWRDARQADPAEHPYADLVGGRTLVAVREAALIGDNFAFAPDGSCEIWRLSEDDATRTHASVTAWLEDELVRHVTAMRAESEALAAEGDERRSFYCDIELA